jgi:hypothetical protein
LNEEQYRQTCEACDQVLQMPGSALERMSIPWLHVLREHPSLLKDYEALFAPSTVLDKAVKVATSRIRSSLGWLRQLWKALASEGEPWIASQPLSAPIDVLFVSHLLNDADAGKADDFYFGSLPESLRAEGQRVVVALIDHTANPDASRVQRWDRSASPRVILSTTLDLQGEMSLHRRLRRESALLASLSRREASGFLRKVLVRASQEAMAGGARATLRMSVQIGRLVSTVKPKMVIVTYEGHAWERVAFSAAREALAGVRCVGYQHAAIFRLQHAALRKLGPAFDPDLILTAGAVSKGQIESSGKVPGIPVRILGSNRAFLGSRSSGATNRQCGDEGNAGAYTATGNVCLVLPEGIVSECLLLFNFSLNCAELMPDMRFIWRLHPLVKFESLIAQNPAFQKLPKNVELSTVTMDEDIARAACALYRGSTAIVKAVCANVQPIYFALPDEMTIDPLYQLGNWRESVKSPEQFASVVLGRSLAADAQEGRITAALYCGNFYLPITPSVVVEIQQPSSEK